MKIAFSIRGINSYPYRWPGPAPVEARRRFFSFARDLGAEGVEVEDTWLPFTEMGDGDLSDFQEEVASFGLSVAALKLGRNNLCLPDERDRNLERTLRAVEIAAILKTEIVTSSLTGGQTVSDPNQVIFQLGSARSVGSSREASQGDYEQSAVRLQKVADAAAEKDLKFALEIHQGSIADNSKATLRLLEMVGRPNVGINPDLGNILWSYNIPEESWADTIQNTAGKMNFWHIKNMRRVYLPEANRSVFIRTNVPDGEIDYRYAVEVAHAAGFAGYISVEGNMGTVGDDFHHSAISIGYLRSIIEGLEQRRPG